MRKNGISLIVLVITIIIIIILVGAIVTFLNKNNILNTSQEAKFKNNISEYNSELMLWTSNEYEKTLGKLNLSEINAYKNEGTYQNMKIQDIITSMPDSDANKFAIINDKLVYIGNDQTETNYYNDLSNNQKIIKGIWYWDLYNEDETSYTKSLNKLNKLGINRVYLSIDSSVFTSDTINKYKSFIRLANSMGIDVYQVTGERRFIYSQAWQSAIYDTIDRIVQYNKTAAQNEKIKGIEYDLEPHLNTDENKDTSISDYVAWDNNDKYCEAKNKYINFVREAQRYAESKQVNIGFDMTWWYCRTTFVENGVEKDLGEEVIKDTNEINIMDYGRQEDWLYGFLAEMDSDEKNPVVKNSGTAIQQLARYNKNFNIGVDFGTFKNFYNDTSLTKPAGYEYNMTYIEQMLKNLKEDLFKYEKDNDIYTNFGMVYHSMSEINELIN